MDAWYEDDEKLDQHLRTLQGLLDEKPLVSGYEQIAHVSSGGQAVVYSATRKGTEQRVALKMFNEKNAWWGRAQIRLQNEARELERLQDPRIVGFVEFLEDRLGRPVLVMEWVDGGSLADHLPFGPRSGHFQTLHALVHCVMEIAGAVQAAHDSGVFHRDLKPRNVLLDAAGRPRLADFGLGQGPAARESALTRVGSVLGTLAYAAPEQLGIAEDLDWARADVYGLGGILLEGLTGQPPHPLRKKTGEREGLAAPPSARVRLRRWDDRLEGIVVRALAPLPEDRYAQPRELIADLLAWLEGRQPVAAPFRPVDRLGWRFRRAFTSTPRRGA
ncbi:MAG: hypothetical protein CMJ94_09340 [Planctomycetes bacterium]|nr:hypothetical protein [Planctomycetota bacterium]